MEAAFSAKAIGLTPRKDARIFSHLRSSTLVIREIDILDHIICFLTNRIRSRAAESDTERSSATYRDTSDVAPQLLRYADTSVSRARSFSGFRFKIALSVSRGFLPSGCKGLGSGESGLIKTREIQIRPNFFPSLSRTGRPLVVEPVFASSSSRD